MKVKKSAALLMISSLPIQEKQVEKKHIIKAFEGLLYVLKNGIPWHAMPREFGF